MPPDGAGASPYTLIYDGNCGVCGSIVAAIQRRDRDHAFEITPSQAPGILERFPWIPAHAFRESLQLVRAADGRTSQGARAVEDILRLLPKGRAVSWLFRIPFVRSVAETGYRWAARNRYLLGCSKHCEVPGSNAR